MIERLIGIGKNGRLLTGFPRMSIDSIAISLDMSGVEVGWYLLDILSKRNYARAVMRTDRNSLHAGWDHYRRR